MTVEFENKHFFVDAQHMQLMKVHIYSQKQIN